MVQITFITICVAMAVIFSWFVVTEGYEWYYHVISLGLLGLAGVVLADFLTK